MRNYNELTRKIIGCAIEVHRELGPGMLEKAYQKALAYELRKAGLSVIEEHPVAVFYKNEVNLEIGYRIDLLVEGKVTVELKAVEKIMDRHHAQVLTQMKFAKLPIGLLINFNVSLLKNSIKRFVMQENF